MASTSSSGGGPSISTSSTRTSKGPCRYYLQGHCMRGDACAFVHDRSAAAASEAAAAASEPCKYFLLGVCRAGAKCPFPHMSEAQAAALKRKHSSRKATGSQGPSVAKPTHAGAVPGASGAAAALPAAVAAAAPRPSLGRAKPAIAAPKAATAAAAAGDQARSSVWGAPTQARQAVTSAGGVARQLASLASLQLCEAHKTNDCAMGYGCESVHGDQCPICLENVLFPADMARETTSARQANARHLASCEEAMLTAMERTAASAVECGICFECPAARGEQFGMLMNCTHVFCLSCIRAWRSTDAGAMSAVRACPLCRAPSHFIVPCERLVTDPDRKSQVIQAYQAKLAAIPCSHYAQGRAVCPFGASCFYMHRNADGSLENRTLYASADGSVRAMGNVLISDFLFPQAAASLLALGDDGEMSDRAPAPGPVPAPASPPVPAPVARADPKTASDSYRV